MKKLLLFFLGVYILSGMALAIEVLGDNVPPNREADVGWTRIDLTIPIITDEYSRMMETQKQLISKQVSQHLEDRDDLILSTSIYDPVIIYYHGNDEYNFELPCLRGLLPGFPIRYPSYVDIAFNGKFLHRESWSYAAYFESANNFAVRGIYYSVMEIELGSGRAQVPLVIVVDNSSVQLMLDGRVK
ncbi:MAG: hypothetical protein ACP5FK_04015 [bacterium]